MTRSYQGLSGAFHFAASTGTWSWSEELYSIYGFGPGEVVPTLELMLFHQHPEDRPSVEEHLHDALEKGRSISLWHRVVDARGTTRQLVTVGGADLADDGSVLAVRGYSTDVTEPVRRTTSEDVQEAMSVIAQSRPVIEQAKGVLMTTYAVDADAAFALLRRYSQLHNVKVRDLARAIVDTMSGRELPVGARDGWDRLAAEMFPGRTEHRSGHRSGYPTGHPMGHRSAPTEQAGHGG